MTRKWVCFLKKCHRPKQIIVIRIASKCLCTFHQKYFTQFLLRITQERNQHKGTRNVSLFAKVLIIKYSRIDNKKPSIIGSLRYVLMIPLLSYVFRYCVNSAIYQFEDLACITFGNYTIILSNSAVAGYCVLYVVTTLSVSAPTKFNNFPVKIE